MFLDFWTHESVNIFFCVGTIQQQFFLGMVCMRKQCIAVGTCTMCVHKSIYIYIACALFCICCLFNIIRFSTFDTYIYVILDLFYVTFNSQTKAPLLDDDETASRWVFDAVSKKQLMNRLWTNMSGSVVCNQSQGNTNRKRKCQKDTQPKKRAAKAKAQSSATASGPKIEPESNMSDTTIPCARGVRQKVWLDDLMQCTNHVISSLKAKPLFDKLDEAQFASMKKELVSIGLIFAFKGQYLLPASNGKGQVYKRWSSLRPALQSYAMCQLDKV